MDEILILSFLLGLYPLFNMLMSNVFVPNVSTSFLQLSDIVSTAVLYIPMTVPLNP